MAKGEKRKHPESGVISQMELRGKVAKLQKFISSKETGK